MIDLEKIPTFTGDLGALERQATSLKTTASSIRGTGKDTHSAFQALDAVYDAPEQEELLGSTVPVRDKADEFAKKLESVSGALTEFASTARPLVSKMKQLREDAERFVAENKEDDDWQKDQDKIDENARLVREVGTTWVAFQGVERDAANKITSLVGGTRFVVDDGSHKAGMYGFKESDVKDARETPWGTADEREYTGLRAAWEWTKGHVGGGLKGFFVDGVWGTIKGLGSMVNVFDWDNFKKTWSGIGSVFGGISAYLITPYDWAMDKMFGPVDHSDREQQKAALRNFGKSLVAWDEWDKDPSRAFGAVLFNGATLGSGSLLKLGKAGKLGVGAEAATVLGKAGALVDPMSYLGKAAGVTKLKVGDFMEGLKASQAGIDDMARNAPAGAPPSGREYIDYAGNKRIIGDDAYIRDEHGNVVPDTQPVREPHKDDLPNTHETSPAEEKVLEGAGGPSHAENSAGHPTGSAHPGDGAHPTGDSGTHHTPSTGGHAADFPTTGDGSGSGVGSRAPSGGGGHGETPGAGTHGHSESTHGGDGAHSGDAGGGPASGSADHGPGDGADGQVEKHTPGTETQEHGGTGTSDASGETGTTPGDRVNEPIPELTAEQRAAHWGHLEDVEKRAPEEFDHLKHDPDHKNQIDDKSMDEARSASTSGRADVSRRTSAARKQIWASSIPKPPASIMTSRASTPTILHSIMCATSLSRSRVRTTRPIMRHGSTNNW